MKSLGSEISLFTDRIGPPQHWQENWLAFSNGRAALAWLFDERGTDSVAVCAYTCPRFVDFLKKRLLEIKLYDVGEEPHGADAIIVPALFGSTPWFYWRRLDEFVIVDAAQTAFGHLDFNMPPNGAILSCPRKCTEMVDGAVLAIYRDGLDRNFMAQNISDLPIAEDAAGAKMIVRAQRERPGDDWLYWNGYAERHWPMTPHRMSDPSRAMLERLDREWHRSARQHNADCLATYLHRLVGRQMWTWKIPAPAPFCFPIFVGNPDEVIAVLKPQEIYLTRLWPDAEHDPKKHPNAAWMAKHLVSLPVDQRHDLQDMERIAKAVLAVAEPPPDPPEGMLRFVS